jgi:hypothetical protein
VFAESWFDPFSFIPGADDTIDKWNAIANEVLRIINWFKHFTENIAHLSIDLMTWSFDALASVVLHTPTIFFKSEWFSNNILMFTGLSIGMSMVLTAIEGLKRILNKKYTKMDRISWRLPLVILGSGLAPIGFESAFSLINKFTDLIIGIARAQMNAGIQSMEFNKLSFIEVLGFIGFDIAMIGMMIPIFLQNFRRWFDLLALGAMTPIALSCWMFKSYEHYFRSWWEHLKKCALVQLVYAVFLLLIGGLMFGAKPPENEGELLIKMGIMIGGLWRMSNPPNMLKRYLDTGTDIRGMWKGAGESVTPHEWLRKGWKLIKRKPKTTGGS